MARRASHKLTTIKLPEGLKGRVPPLSLSSVGHEDVDDSERDRIGSEGSKGAWLITKARPAQQQLLERLARAAGDRGVRFRSIAVLESFLAATRSMDAKAAKALSDDQLAKLWRDAETSEPTEVGAATPEPQLRVQLAKGAKAKQPTLAVEVVGRTKPAPAIPDRAAQEAHIGGVLLAKAKPAQSSLLERLVRNAGADGLHFPVLSVLTRFLAATRTLTVKAATTLSDEELAKLWHDASDD
jgi:hypothetical protein